MNPVISVVIPVYNASRWLRKSLKSIFAQRLNEALEVIIVDDGSVDESSEIIHWEAKRSNQPVKLVRNEKNMGIVASLNRGLDEARGRFIARMDADDICMPIRFRRQLQFLRDSGTDLCGSWFVEFGRGYPHVVRWPHSEDALKAAMLFQNTICHPSVMARREIFDRYRYRENYRLAEDYDLFARAMTDHRIANVPEALLRYRRHPNQATQAQRQPMEEVTRRIRLEIMARQSIDVSAEEEGLHNMIRAPYSITRTEDLLGIEKWLIKLLSLYQNHDARAVISGQWIRACIRAAPLGSRMHAIYRHSHLRAGLRPFIDLSVLATMRLDYNSKPFLTLRNLGLSA